MKKTLLICSLLFCACSNAPAITGEGTTESVSSSVAIKELEPLPSELSIEHFSEMNLVGTGLTLETVLAKNSNYTRYQISYLSNGLKISGILNVPVGEGPFPLVIFNHGYIAPSVYTVGRGLKREQDYIARQGFAVLHTDYRGHGESDESPDTERRIYDAGLEYSMDSINAINAVRAAKDLLPTVDSTKVGMLGHSMGGGVTMNILTAFPSLVSAGVLYAPVNTDAYENFNRWRRERESDDNTTKVMGQTREEHPELWDALSSQTYLQNITAPILLFQGTNDKDVPYEWSDELDVLLNEAGKDAQYERYEGEGHEFGPQWTDFMQKTAEFFRKHLEQRSS